METVAEGQRSAQRRNEAIVALAVVTLLIVAWMARQLVNGVSDPLLRAVHVARHVAQGDLTQQIAAHTRKDETGHLMRALHDMQEGLARIVTDVRAGTLSMDSAAREIADGNRDLSARTERQAAAIQETAANMEQLSGTVKLNAEHARLADEMVQEARSVARKGGEAVDEVVRTMSMISSSSRQIAEITAVIDSIAFQTNILALNAAVEAARAGAHGRGFGVVAAEVRALAQRSAEAAKEIRDLVVASNEKVSAGNRLVESAGKTMADIVVSVQRVSELMSGINSASAQQSIGIAEASQALNNMQDSVQQNAALVEQATAASQGLRRHAAHLSELVNAFKLRAVQRPVAPAAGQSAASIVSPPAASKLGQRPLGAVPDVTGAGWEEF